MMEISTLRDVVSIGSPFMAFVGAGYLVWYRLGRIEHLLSNANGLVQRMERVERDLAGAMRICNERHKG